jgi:hypothetical protein
MNASQIELLRAAKQHVTPKDGRHGVTKCWCGKCHCIKCQLSRAQQFRDRAKVSA